MSTLWRTRHRVLAERLERFAGQLRRDEPIPPAALKEHTIRLLAGILPLLSRHEVNDRGQCRICRGPKTWRFWRTRPRCTVYRSLDFAMTQPLEVMGWPFDQR